MTMNYNDAVKFATVAHAGQKRKFTGGDYVTHPIAVASMVMDHLANIGFDKATIELAGTIAVLHDTVEDTDVEMEDIQKLFGDTVAKGVWFLTKVPSYVGNRAERKALCDARLANAPLIVKEIKRYDMLHNQGSLKEHDPNFYEVWFAETLTTLAQMGFSTLWTPLTFNAKNLHGEKKL